MPHAPSSEPMSGPPPAATSAARDHRLRSARRIDWRFLGPSPELGRIAVAGTPDATLLAALDAADPRGTVERLDVHRPTGGAGFGTVVLSGYIRREEVLAAAAAVEPGGRVVAEFGSPLTGLLAGGRTGRPGGAVRLARTLRAGGFAARTWVAWPTHERAAAWAAVDDPLAVRALVRRRLGGPAGAAAAATARSLAGRDLGRRLLAIAAPAVTVVAERPTRRTDGAGPARPDGEAWIARLLSTNGDADGGVTGRRGLLVLGPRYRASAHVVGLELGALADGPRRVAKVARLPDDTGLAHEVTILRALAAASGSSADGRHPVVIEEAGGGDWPRLVETGIAGTPLDPSAVRADRPGAVRGITDWLSTLPVEPAGNRTIRVGDRLSSALGTVRAVASDHPALRQLVDRTEPIVAPLAGAALPRVFEHGDPAHPNLMRLADGRIGAVDWERGDPDGLPLHDLTIALAYLAAADRDARDPAAQSTAFSAALAAPDSWAADALDAEARRLGIDPALRPALVVCAWLRSSAWLADRLVDGRAGGGSPGLESADGSLQDLASWLGADRSVALWGAALAIAEATERGAH